MASEALSDKLRDAGWTQHRLAEALGITQGAVWQWTKKRVPAERVLDFERITGIPRTVIRPDLYPSEEQAA